MFVDHVNIQIQSGSGGNGCVSFYRAKYITHGGPDGGDGGRGGDVIFVADAGLTTLMDFRYQRKFKAPSGEDGSKRNRSGKDAEDVVIKVPVGTVIREGKTNKVMADMAEAGLRVALANGGRGGRGNQHFATPAMQAPRYAEAGKPAKAYGLVLELKLIADAGLIGLPNAGKSSLLSMATNANPKIANYHFTTLSPNLGVVRGKWGDDFVLADIPGLIEGASGGAGLGHDFLRHVERTKALIHVVDAAGLEGGDPADHVEMINAELKAHSEALVRLPQVIAANKTDLPGAMENAERLKRLYEPRGVKVFPVSAATGDGIGALLETVAGILKDCPKTIVFEADYDEYDGLALDAEPYTVRKTKEHYYTVEGAGVEKMLALTDLNTEKGFAFFQKYLRDKGINARLAELGALDGDTVRLMDAEFEYIG